MTKGGTKKGKYKEKGLDGREVGREGGNLERGKKRDGGKERKKERDMNIYREIKEN